MAPLRAAIMGLSVGILVGVGSMNIALGFAAWIALFSVLVAIHETRGRGGGTNETSDK